MPCKENKKTKTIIHLIVTLFLIIGLLANCLNGLLTGTAPADVVDAGLDVAGSFSCCTLESMSMGLGLDEFEGAADTTNGVV